MFRSLLVQRLFPQVPSRLINLRQYVCLREATNPKAQQEFTSKFQSIAAKHQISPQELTSMHSVVQLNQLNRPENYPNQADYTAQMEQLTLLFRNTPYSVNSLQSTANSFLFRVPELNSLTSPFRLQAAQEIASIYLHDVNLNNFISPDYSQTLEALFQQRTSAVLAKLKKEINDPQLYLQIESVLQNIFLNYQVQGAKYIGLIKSYVDHLEGTEIAVPKQSTFNLADFNEKEAINALPGLSQEDREYARNVDASDLKLFLQEVYEEEYSKGFAQNRYNEKGQKLVYESQLPNSHVLRYQVLAAVFGGLFLYLFYRGDSYYSTILIVPTVAATFFYLSKQHQARRAIPVIRQFLRNQDNSYEVVFEQNKMISRIENVSANSIKINMNKQPSHQLLKGRPTDIGYHLEINGNSYIAPYLYSGNNIDFRQLVSL